MSYVSVVLDFKGVKQDHFKVVNTIDERILNAGDAGVGSSYSCGDNLRIYAEMRRHSPFWDYVDSANQITTSVNGEVFIINYYKAGEAPEFMRQN
jgi:hypothetical protein